MADPRTWLLLGRKAGDNTQVRALASALGWPCEEKKVYAKPWELLVHLLPQASLLGIDRGASSELSEPWPDLVISAGRRNEPVARWIARQSRGRTKLVHIGRPWAHPKNYDLLVSTPQYLLAGFDNVQMNSLPLHSLRRDDVEAEGTILQTTLDQLPAPYTCMLVGGDSGPFVFTPDKARRLGAEANAAVARSGGGLLISNSARTSEVSWQALLAELNVPYMAYDCRSDSPNPYLAFLGLADRFIVTGESMSMLAEAVAMDRPVQIFDMSDQGPWFTHFHSYRYKPLSFRLAMALAPKRMRRDISRIQSALVGRAGISWLGEDVAQATESVSDNWKTELEISANRVRSLF